MVVKPEATAVIMPPDEIVATLVVPLAHAPPEELLVRVAVAPAHALVLPAIAAGNALTVTTAVALQPVDNV
jgi:hypothetical protein